MREWLYYNTAAGSLHTKKLCTRLYLIEVDFCSKKIAFWATLSGLTGNLRTPSLIGKLVVDFLFVIIDFAISYGWVVMSGNLSKSAFFEGGGSLTANIWQGRGHRPTLVGGRCPLPCQIFANVGVRKLEWLPFPVVSKYPKSIIYFCHNTRVWRTAGQTDSNTVRCITCRTVKMVYV